MSDIDTDQAGIFLQAIASLTTSVQSLTKAFSDWKQQEKQACW